MMDSLSSLASIGGHAGLESFANSAAASASAASANTSINHKNPFAIQELLGLSEHHNGPSGPGGADTKEYKFHQHSAAAAAAVSAAAAVALSQSTFSGCGSGVGVSSAAKSLLTDTYSSAASLAAAANSQRMYLNSSVLSPSAANAAFSSAAFSGIPPFFHVDSNKQDPYGKTIGTFKWAPFKISWISLFSCFIISCNYL